MFVVFPAVAAVTRAVKDWTDREIPNNIVKEEIFLTFSISLVSPRHTRHLDEWLAPSGPIIYAVYVARLCNVACLPFVTCTLFLPDALAPIATGDPLV